MYFLRSWLGCLKVSGWEKNILWLAKFLLIFLYRVCFFEIRFTFILPQKSELISLSEY